MKTLPIILSLMLIATGMRAQTPQLTVGGKTDGSQVYLHALDIQTEVAGNIATTRFTMTFQNRTRKVLEGELLFPLPNGVTVSHYALDINGRMRDAVPVEKAHATQVFEEIEQRRVDPGLLERVEGNSFRTRIYPIPASGTRTITIGYEQELPVSDGRMHYRLPTDFAETINNFTLRATVWQTEEAPRIEAGAGELQFDTQRNAFISNFERKDYIPPKLLAFSLPVSSGATQVFVQSAQGSYYFTASCTPKSELRTRQWSSNIGIIWDASLSALHRDASRELELLDRIFNSARNCTVTLHTVSNRFENAGTFNIKNGDWTALRSAIESTVYDGGTDFSAIRLDPSVHDYLLFSDGLSSLSPAEISAAKAMQPVHCITSSPRADYSALRWLAAQTGGNFVDLNALSQTEAIDVLTRETLRFLGVKRTDGSIREIYPSIPQPVSGRFTVAGIMDAPTADLTLLFGYGSTPSIEQPIRIDSHSASTQAGIHRVWAQKKIAELDMRYETNKQEITAIGQQFGIVTRGTSLMVLETAADYAQYRITPPKELLAEYNRLTKGREDEEQRSRTNLMEYAKTAAGTLKKWWDTDFTPVKPKYPTPDGTPNTGGGNRRSAPQTPNTGDGNRPSDLSTPRTIAGTVTGTVLDENGEPFPGVNIGLRGTNTGTVSDPNGQFSLDVPAGTPVIEANFIGCNTHAEAVGNRSQINIQMTAASTSLDEVVVVGSGVRRRQTFSASASTVRENRSTRRESRRPPAEPQMEMMILADDVAVEEAEANVIYSMNDAPMQQTQGKASTRQPEIKITAIRQDRDYMKALTGKTDDDYRTYISIRADYSSSPTFYFDMADWFFTHGDRTRAIRILTSIADMELENAQLMRLLGYRLKEYGEYALEEYACKKLIQWRPFEPQNYRDHALAIADAGQPQRALDSLNATLTRTYPHTIAMRSRAIVETIVTEINRLVAMHPDLDLSRTDRALIFAMPIDIRTVINWSMNNTDIDLHVTDPAGETCYYSHPATAAGGRISRDVTTGYGPEQYLVRRAQKGKYSVYVNYFGDTQVKAEGPSTVMLEIFTGYASKTEQRRVVCLQLSIENKKTANGLVQVAEFEF